MIHGTRLQSCLIEELIGEDQLARSAARCRDNFQHALSLASGVFLIANRHREQERINN
jgi:hypothetical protein